MVFQSYALYPHMSVFENIAFPLQMEKRSKADIREEVAKAAATVQLTTRLQDKPSKLSGGQRQRVAIARAIAMKPPMLVLDDATAAVDATTEARIRLGLREAMKGRTTLIIAHRLSTISLADEVVVLDHGRVVARGTQAELAESSPVYREIYEHGLVDRELAARLEATA
jgi:multiple sugar transport system ATP-binding protein